MPKKKNPLLQKLGDNIRVLRNAKNLSQEKLAFSAELDRTYIGGIERGERNVAILNLCRIASVLQVTPAKLLKDIEWPYPL
jgi:transcriptional regulator with XRE-family HTH domain